MWRYNNRECTRTEQVMRIYALLINIGGK
jgi:hypothetical protein